MKSFLKNIVINIVRCFMQSNNTSFHPQFEHGGNGATAALDSPWENEKRLRGSIVCKLDPNWRDIERTCLWKSG